MEDNPRNQSTATVAMATKTDLCFHFPRRSTVSAQRPAGSNLTQARPKNPNGQCTHLTMTRLYTKEFHCSICLRTGPFGWLYRCTQDRELLLEDDMETGSEVPAPLPSMKSRMLRSNQEKLDDMCNIFPRPASPRKRGPLARMNKFSVVSEMGGDQLRQYTVKQFNEILKQRAHVLERANQPDFTPIQAEISSFKDLANSGLNRALNELGRSTNSPDISVQKPWLPLKGGECQFKCCHFCRPSLKDRTFLSIDGIANDDLPATAITGFGFHLAGSRPVASVEIVKNIGLRPNPTRLFRSDAPTPILTATLAASPQRKAATLGLGLGILNNINIDDTTPAIISPIPISPNAVFFDTSNKSSSAQNQSAIRTFPLLNTIAPTQRRHSISVPSSTSGAEAACQTPLPDQTPEELKLIQAGLMLTPHPERGTIEMKMIDGARLLSPMEKSELVGVFGREPLDVEDGIAMMEESVELHVPDVITQY